MVKHKRNCHGHTPRGQPGIKVTHSLVDCVEEANSGEVRIKRVRPGPKPYARPQSTGDSVMESTETAIGFRHSPTRFSSPVQGAPVPLSVSSQSPICGSADSSAFGHQVQQDFTIVHTVTDFFPAGFPTNEAEDLTDLVSTFDDAISTGFSESRIVVPNTFQFTFDERESNQCESSASQGLLETFTAVIATPNLPWTPTLFDAQIQDDGTAYVYGCLNPIPLSPQVMWDLLTPHQQRLLVLNVHLRELFDVAH